MSTPRKFLLVEDGDDLRDSLREKFKLHDEFELTIANSASKGMELAKTDHYALVLLDIALPELDGQEAVRVLRKSGSSAPIILLSARTSDADQILGLEAGANDYVTKPIKFSVLLARIRSQIRQHEQSENPVFAIGSYTFVPADRILLHEQGHKIRLTEKENLILKHLYRAGEKVVLREVLLREVWGFNADVATHTVETHIYRLRKKIEKDSANAELLLTEAGGYRLVP
jgi:DNA-binding response OmpR family regulator